jgi:hypothetical protein
MARRVKLAYPGMDDGLVQKLVINPRATITPQDVMKQRNSLQKMVDGLGRPLYKTSTELDNAVKQVLQGARQMAGFAATSAAEYPTPPAAPGRVAPAAGAPRRFKFNPSTTGLDPVEQSQEEE